MTTRKLPTVIYKIHPYCNNFIAQLFQKSQKNGNPHFATRPRCSRQPPLQLKKNPNGTLCSRDNSLHPDEEIKYSLNARIMQITFLNILYK